MLDGNGIGGSLPPNLGNLEILDTLQLGGNHLNGEIPTSIGKMTLLKKVDLSGNELSSVIPSSILFLLDLKELNLANNRLVSPIPDLSKLAKLNKLYLSGNKFDEELVHTTSITTADQITTDEAVHTTAADQTTAKKAVPTSTEDQTIPSDCQILASTLQNIDLTDCCSLSGIVCTNDRVKKM
jgi:Leucine-rich repeat (LRR) protein